MATMDVAQLERLVRSVGQMADPMFVTDIDGAIIFANDALLALTGYTSEELLGQNPRILKSGKHDGEFYAALWRTITAGQIWQDEIVNRAKDGTLYRKRLTITPVRDDSGAVSSYVAFALDLSKEVQLEMQVRQSQKLEAIGQLASGIAHEINTPTQYIGDNVQFLKEIFGGLMELLTLYERLGEEVREGKDAKPTLDEIAELSDAIDLPFLLEETPGAIERTLEGNQRVAEVVRAMKEFAHPGTEEMTLADLNHAVENTVAVSRNAWKYVAAVETELDPDLPLVPCLPGAINQVLLNLVVNAAQAIEEDRKKSGGEKGSITLVTRHDGDYVEVQVRDNGPGIPESLRERIFNPFFTTKDVGIGTGQGLAIARSVVADQHGGSLDFESNENGGTTFVVRLPLNRR